MVKKKKSCYRWHWWKQRLNEYPWQEKKVIGGRWAVSRLQKDEFGLGENTVYKGGNQLFYSFFSLILVCFCFFVSTLRAK